MTFLLKKRNHITVRSRPLDVPSPSVFRVKFKVLHLGLKATRGSFSASARTTLLTTHLTHRPTKPGSQACLSLSSLAKNVFLLALFAAV